MKNRIKGAIFTLINGILIMCLFSFCADKNKAKNASPVFIEPDTEKPDIVLISVYDNYKIKAELKTAWGFASIIETPAEKILFDTGGDPVILLSNMQKMNIDPGSIHKVIISHVHGDHTGGLEDFLEKNNKVTVFIPASFPHSIKDMITDKGAKYTEVSESMKISDFVYSTGELNGLLDEQALIIDSKKGLIVITGCAHPGIVKIIEKAKTIMKRDSVYLVAGGFHRPPMAVVKKFRELGMQKVAPSHCTGDDVREAFAEEYKEDFVEYGIGKRIEIK
ncbi:MAG: MBL fold metallo-hydrolase [Bacteroidales bacterium]|nr:MBL fold metallo-hydrolase [Bacteroidales bacterium]